ncbi:MAG: hypothetical protein ACYDCK_00850 [Thermoplasmatota archaeon]
MRTSVRLGLAFVGAAVTLAVMVVTAGGGGDVLVVLLLLALLVSRELASPGARGDLRARTSLFVFAGILAFVAIVVARVRAILNL